MLELLIGLFLVTACALPLAQLPMKAIKEQTQSFYRIQIHRLADLAFAQMKEKLYRQEISWEDLSRSSNSVILDDIVTLQLGSLGSQKFIRKIILSSVGKQGKEGEEWRLATFKIKFHPLEKKHQLFQKRKKSSVFSYRVILNNPVVSASKKPKDVQATLPPVSSDLKKNAPLSS